MAISDIFSILGLNSPAGPSYGAGDAATAANNPLAAVAAPSMNGYNENDVRQAQGQMLMQLAPLLIAGGMRQMPSQRAATTAASAAVLGQMPHNILNAAQTRLLNQKEAQAQNEYAAQQEAIKTALADPSVPEGVKNYIKADGAKGLAYLAQLQAPVPKQDAWSIANTDYGPMKINSATGDTIPMQGYSAPDGASNEQNGTQIPPGVNPKKFFEEQAKKRADRLDELSRSGETAQNLVPTLQTALDTYGELAKRKAIGPIQGSSPARFVESVAPVASWNKDEALRQKFEQAKKQLELFKAQTDMARQGQITESERKLLSLATGGALDAVDPATGMAALQQAMDHAQKAIVDARNAREGKLPDLQGNAPQQSNTTQAQPDMSQARQAPDGHTYVPDPARPGKYLRVN